MDITEQYLKDIEQHKRYEPKYTYIDDRGNVITPRIPDPLYKADRHFLIQQILQLRKDKANGWWSDVKESQLKGYLARLQKIEAIYEEKKPKPLRIDKPK